MSNAEIDSLLSQTLAATGRGILVAIRNGSYLTAGICLSGQYHGPCMSKTLGHTFEMGEMGSDASMPHLWQVPFHHVTCWVVLSSERALLHEHFCNCY